jgi:hypothetical protein
MGGNQTIDINGMVDQLGVIAWRMAQTLPEYLPFIVAGIVLIVFGNVLRKPRTLALGSARMAGDAEEPDITPGVGIALKALRIGTAMALRAAGKLTIIGCIGLLTLRASGFEETTAFVDANFETLMRIAQSFR